ncbi:hypothetical protein BX616_006780 [Lobosporangium transversale]|nr:hypothetical protein BX616_006780 [Lobosporangium transversale]
MPIFIYFQICKGQDRLKAVVNYDPSFYLIRNLATSRGSVVQLRMIEALASLAGESQESLNLLESMGLLDSLKNGLGAVDILTRFNIIEILSEFGATKAGSQYLDQSGILKRLGEVVQFEVQDDELGTTAIIKLYGKLGSSTDIDFIALDMKYQILSQLQWILVGSDDYTPSESLQVEAMATFGLSGGNIRNLEWVCDSSCASTFIGLLSTLRRDSKVGWYHSLAQILACSKLEEPGQSPFITRLLVSAKSQTTELSMSALTVMISLARYPFGVQVAKFEVIEAVLKTYDDAKRTSNTSLLMNDQVSHLDLIRRQGPFYQRATATVAIQDIAA